MSEPAQRHAEPVIGVIGGSGLYDIEGLTDTEWLDLTSPFGEPSTRLLAGTLEGVRVVFLPRHGRGHRIPPTAINYRANIDVLKRAGVTDIVSLSAVGSLREDIAPGSFVIVDQFVDRTFAREKSFFGTGLAAHVAMADPVCRRIGDALEASARALGLSAHRGGTYLAIEGPQFSTRAESEVYRAWGCSVIGMTNMPEAKLAREAELCYATVAMVTDYDTWHADHDAVDVATVVRVMNENAAHARALIRQVVPAIAAGRAEACEAGCDRALETAIMTAPEARDPSMVARLDAVAGRVLGGEPALTTEPHAGLKALIRTIPDYPKPGILFRDVTTLLANPQGFAATIDALAAPYLGPSGGAVRHVAAIEARGFILGGAIADRIGAGFIPVRKRGKLPHTTVGVDYALEYGVDRVEVHADAIEPGDRILVIDDLIATGGTALAAIELIEQLGGAIVGVAAVIDLPDLGGSARIRALGHAVHVLCAFEGD